MEKKDIWKDQEKGKEEDYFMKKHREWLERNKLEKKELDKKKKEARKDRECPLCLKPLTETKRGPWVVLECGSCKGGWLDQETLEKLIASASPGREK